MSEAAATPTSEVGAAAESKQVVTPADAGKPATAPETPPAVSTPESKATEPAKPVVPEKYDLKLPEGSQLDAKAIERISLQSKEKGLSNEQAQAVIESESKAIATFVEGEKERVKARTDVWRSEVQADPELGGDGYKKNVELAKRVVQRFGTDALMKTLDDTGLGNYPELVRFVSRIGKAMSEDQLIHPSTGGSKKSAGDIFYPKQNQKE